MLREGAFWNIFLYSYPSEWSWAEALPEKLVEAALCPRGRTCRVAIFRQ
ncbi:MAG TPA: hypothetical protein VJ001_00755 [Rhodocyclaceae bacterium]|nr:hypothetical protein [Rhodocyclaceae bacterium]